jgi:hypothetical protein
MLDRLRSLLFEPRYPQRYIGRHRAPNGTPVISMSVHRPGRVPA